MSINSELPRGQSEYKIKEGFFIIGLFLKRNRETYPHNYICSSANWFLPISINVN